jgi:hypothetical protein
MCPRASCFKIIFGTKVLYFVQFCPLILAGIYDEYETGQANRKRRDSFCRPIDFIADKDKRPEGWHSTSIIAENNLRDGVRMLFPIMLIYGRPGAFVPTGYSKIERGGPLQEDGSSDSAPFCPQCGLVMVLRIHREGTMAGKRYYGCMNAPACSGVIPID